MINFVILIGVIIIVFGYENFGVFLNLDDLLVFLFKVVGVEGEGVWCLLMGDVYDVLLKLVKVDMKNIGGCVVGLIIVV